MTLDQGEKDLQTLLKDMQPVMDDEEMVICSLAPKIAEDYMSLAQGYYVEGEGVTVIISKHLADLNGLPYVYVFRRISLMVHSSLDAVGFLARITEVLAAQGISVNAISAYYHDYLYIRSDQAENAFKTLKLWQKKLLE
jgi:hypothetical protein